jgi:hypothetical protein
MSTANAAFSVEPASVVVTAVVATAHFLKCQDKKKKGGKRGATQKCVQCDVPAIYTCLGPSYFWRAYQMTHASFWRLYSRLAPRIEAAREAYYGYEKKGGRAGGNFFDLPVPNGPILGSACLGCALRYFAGGSPMTYW